LPGKSSKPPQGRKATSTALINGLLNAVQSNAIADRG
jgi:hypothetical protein